MCQLHSMQGFHGILVMQLSKGSVETVEPEQSTAPTAQPGRQQLPALPVNRIYLQGPGKVPALAGHPETVSRGLVFLLHSATDWQKQYSSTRDTRTCALERAALLACLGAGFWRAEQGVH